MASRDLDAKLLDLDGKDFEPALTVGFVCYQAVGGMAPGEQIPLADKLKLYNLAKKIHAGGVQDFTAEELAKMKERVGASFSTMVVGVLCEFLDKDPVSV